MDTQHTINPPGGEGARHDHQDHSGGGEHLVIVLVNGHPVKLLGHTETGLQIKTAAIEQGVQIHLKFLLEEEVADGKRRLIENDERVELRSDLKFFAHEGKGRTVTISVNEQPVTLTGDSATGAEIKAAAISQGVHIQPNFVLQEELPNGTSKIIGDEDPVHLREHLRFTAIAPDDNS